MVKIKFKVEETRLVERELDIPEGELVLLTNVPINGSKYPVMGYFRGFSGGYTSGSDQNSPTEILIANPHKIILGDDVRSKPEFSRVRSRTKHKGERVYKYTLKFQNQVFQGEDSVEAYFSSLGREYLPARPYVERLNKKRSPVQQPELV